MIKKIRNRIAIELVVLVAVMSLPALSLNNNIAKDANNYCVFAASNGADAHSKSMSVGSGDPEVNKKKSDKQSEEASSSNDDAYDDSQVTGESGYTSEDQVKTGEEAEKELKVEKKKDISAEGKAFPTVWVVVTIAVAVCALVAAIMLFRSRRKDKYESKH